MAKTKYRSTKRFGPRYGRTLRDRVGKIEADYRKKHSCPYCNLQKVKRVSAGIWACGKCGAKFTARAYTPQTRKLQTKQEEQING